MGEERKLDYSPADLSKNGGICMATGQPPTDENCNRENEERCMYGTGKCREYCSVGNDQIHNSNRLNRIRDTAPDSRED
jgi:hypothetical protein